MTIPLVGTWQDSNNIFINVIGSNSLIFVSLKQCTSSNLIDKKN